jgi:hypothetical protein
MNEVKLIREFSNVFAANRLNIYCNGVIVNGFPDTEQGMELAKQCYLHTINKVKFKKPDEVIESEIVVIAEQPQEKV